MRILLLNDRIPPENRGGAGIVVWRLALQLKQMGHEVHVISATNQPSFEEIREGIPTYHVGVNYPDRFRAWLSLFNPTVHQAIRALYHRIQPDVVNGHNIHQYLTYHSLTIAHKMGIPTIFSSHDVMPFAYHKLSHFIDPSHCGVRSVDDYRIPRFYNLKQMRLRYNPVRNIVIQQKLAHDTHIRTTPSQELANAHSANDLPPFTVIHNGIDPDHFHASEEIIDTLRTRLGLDGRKVILFAGRLTGAKGTTQLLDALQVVVKDVPQTTLLVLSSTPIEEQIQGDKYQQLRDDHIVSGGWLDGEDLAAAFHISHVMAAPSVIFDTFPTVNLEAMATHSVVLASCYGGSREAVLDGETGYIINPFDTVDFAQKIIHLLTDEDLRQSMADKAYQRVTEHFTLSQQASKMLRLFEEAQSQL